jgi:elongation factor P
MISTNQFKIGMTILIGDEIYQIIDFQHVKPGKGAAFVRTKLKSFKTGAVIEKNFRAGERFETAHLNRREMQYLYRDGQDYVFMDMETYEQLSLNQEQIEEAVKYLKEGQIVLVVLHEGSPIGVELPTSVELSVIETDPGLRGDTATGGTKPAKLETGATIQVPLFIQVGDVIKVDTRTGEYITRA